MFSKASKASNVNMQSQESRTEAAVKAVPSIISADLSIKGDLESGGEIQVDGVVNGDIRCKALIVGVKGSVVGEVSAQTVRLHGAVKGMIRAKSVFLASTARMSGDVGQGRCRPRRGAGWSHRRSLLQVVHGEWVA